MPSCRIRIQSAVAALCVLLCLCSFGCESENHTEPVKPFVPSTPYALEKPSDMVSNMQELVAICDYYAFYGQEEFTVTLTDDYAYSVAGNEDIRHELNCLYFNSELINGAIGMNAAAEGNRWHFRYTIYDCAVKDSPEDATVLMNDIGYTVPVSTRTADYNEFATEDESRPACEVTTSQQLWYAAEHHYRILPVKGSAAERYYEAAKEILRQIIEDGQSDFEKIAAIYEYIIHTAKYDHKSAEAWKEGDDPDLYPDVHTAPYKCYFLEGFFDNHTVVCDGLAKVYTLLASMEGIDIVRAMGAEEGDYESRNVFGHAYCFVKCFDRWFLSCPTWGQPVFSTDAETDAETDSYLHCIQQSFLLTSHDAIDTYKSDMWQEIQAKLVQSEADYTASGVNPVLEYYHDRTVEGISCVLTADTADEDLRWLVDRVRQAPCTQIGLCATDYDVLLRLNDLLQEEDLYVSVTELPTEPVIYDVILLHI